MSVLKNYTIAIAFVFALFISCNTHAQAKAENECRSLDVSEFGLISDGSISAPWTEVQLMQKYGPPCAVLDLGDVFIERKFGRLVEVAPKTKEQSGIISGQIAQKRQLVYWGDSVDKTSVITVIDGVVVKKERIYD